LGKIRATLRVAFEAGNTAAIMINPMPCRNNANFSGQMRCGYGKYMDDNRGSDKLVQAHDSRHEWLLDLRSAHRGSISRQVASGAILPFRSVRFLFQNRKLLPLIVVPALINMLLFGVSAYLLLTHAGEWLGWLWEKPGGSGFIDTLLVGVWYVVYAIALAACLVLSYIVVLIAGGILASPFHDILSEHTERILLGVEELESTGLSFTTGMLKSILSDVTIALLYAAVMVPILLLNFIPVLGSIAATALGSVASAYFVGLEYSDPLLQRREVPVRRKFRLIRDNFWLAGSFGLATSFCLWVPFLNFFCMPIAVIGGTALGIALTEDAGQRVDSPDSP
jgi:CysZ protein